MCLSITFPEQVQILRGHTGLVKGVTWDPVGRYLASQADDKSLRIWRTTDWTTEEKIIDPFSEVRIFLDHSDPVFNLLATVCFQAENDIFRVASKSMFG